jgi:acyl carrier protein
MKKGVVDSRGVLEVMQFLSDTFEVTPADDEITEANLGSLRSTARFVHQKLQ